MKLVQLILNKLSLEIINQDYVPELSKIVSSVSRYTFNLLFFSIEFFLTPFCSLSEVVYDL